MHISDGVLSAQVLAGGAAAAAAGTAVGLKKMDYDRVPKVAVLSSAFFIASLIHVPVGPSSVHLTLIGLMGLILGWASFPAVLIGLLLQAVLFQFGGITVLGVNTVNMALPAVVSYFIFSTLVKSEKPLLLGIGSFMAGAFAVMLASVFTALSLVFTGEEFMQIARMLVAANLPLMGIEGIITVFIVQLLKKVRPEMLEVPRAVAQKT
ncbi:MAG: cobalt transporter CbiM [Spirochaetota bacterium]